jgi:hypothetical protein
MTPRQRHLRFRWNENKWESVYPNTVRFYAARCLNTAIDLNDNPHYRPYQRLMVETARAYRRGAYCPKMPRPPLP